MAEEAVKNWIEHVKYHDTVVRPRARQNTETAAQRMVAASLRKYGKLKPEFLEAGDPVRVSFLALASVQALVKSGILGEPAPMFSPKMYQVIHVHNHGAFCTYDVASREVGDNEVQVSTRTISMPNALFAVPRHMLLYQTRNTHHVALGRRYPHYVDAALRNAL